MSSHVPVNHPLRPVYRVVAALTGGYLITFGVVGLVATHGEEWFAQGDWSALGVATNRAFALLMLLTGAAVVVAAVVGRNVDRAVSLYGGAAALVLGTAVMALIETEANPFSSGVSTSVMLYLTGMVLILCAMYLKVEPAAAPVAPSEERAAAFATSADRADDRDRDRELAGKGSTTGTS